MLIVYTKSSRHKNKVQIKWFPNPIDSKITSKKFFNNSLANQKIQNMGFTYILILLRFVHEPIINAHSIT